MFYRERETISMFNGSLVQVCPYYILVLSNFVIKKPHKEIIKILKVYDIKKEDKTW